MQALIKFGQYTILVPIDTLGCVDGFGYTGRGFISGQKLINAEILAWLPK